MADSLVYHHMMNFVLQGPFFGPQFSLQASATTVNERPGNKPVYFPLIFSMSCMFMYIYKTVTVAKNKYVTSNATLASAFI
jgi:hypothetical protein